MLHPSEFSRRRFLQTGLFATASCALMSHRGHAADPQKVAFGFSLYGMRKLPVKEALNACADIGYDCVELACMTDWPCAPESLSAAVRQDIRNHLSDRRLALASLMENLSPLADEATHATNLERLKSACGLGHELSPQSTPIIETVLGGQPAQWEQVRDKMVARLSDWAKIAQSEKTVFALKPHVAGALHTPEGAVWLTEQLKSPWLRLAYDYSHYELRAIPMKSSLDSLLPKTSFIHVKDTEGTAAKFQFLLPGDGRTNYPDMFQHLKVAGYTGSVVVEVSGQIHTKEGYDPIQAARHSFANLAPLLEKSGIWQRRA